jgi:peptidoglycan/LPS O-acetylase OafA/YrhL
MKYRPEIDGLRALAVVPVILFHAGFELFKGGYVGVDVFFVISGYLITTILIEDIENKKFSIINFYERRARRILPALFFVMMTCIPFAWAWMLPNQIKDFSQSLVAVSLFVSNIQFWRESGYFDATAEEKPLLHTWSLAVEEQYYLLFPIFLIFVWRLGKNKVFWIIAAMSAFSLILSEWGVRKNSNANFYLAPFRAWEIFAGSLTAFIVQKRGVIKNNLFSLLGLTMIIVSIFIYDEKTPFPSIYTLLPVLGTVLLILFTKKETLVSSLLSNKVVVLIGLVSYSAYLWHQPLFAFARIRLSTEPSITLMIILSILSIILATFSWKYIEKPLRDKNLFSRFKVFVFSLFTGFIIISFGLLVHFNAEKFIPNHDWIKILNGNTGLGEKCDAKSEFIKIKDCSTSSQPVLAIYGDSYAMHLIDGFSNEFKESYGLIQLTKSGCAPLKNIAQKDDRYQDCVNFNSKSLEYLKDSNSIKVIVISSRFGLLDQGEKILINNEKINEETRKNQVVINALSSLIKELKDSGKSVLLFSSTPKPKNDLNPMECILKAKMHNNNLQNCEFTQQDRFKNIGLFIFDQVEIEESLKIDLTKQICNKEKCKPYFDEQSIYGSGLHLSKGGANYLGKKYEWEKLVTSHCKSETCKR